MGTNILRVRAIKKYHDAKGILIGYTIQDENGQTMDVHKDQLKQAVASGQCEVVNMTLTSDGRLIGKASKEKKPRQSNKTGINLLEVYTNGKNIVGAMVHSDIYGHTDGLNDDISFEVGFEAVKNMAEGLYDNIKVIDGKPDLSGVKRKSFKNVKDKMFKVLVNNGVKLGFEVAKMEKKYEYAVIANCENGKLDAEESTLLQIVHCLINDAMATAKIKSVYINGNTYMVGCMTGITDVRKAVKSIKPSK